MKKSGILNAQLIRCIAELGHKDLFMIGDAGMPIPKGVEIVDLVVCGGVPTFKQVMDAVLAETEVEAYTIANEIEEKNPELLAYIQQNLPEAEESRIDHVDLKKMSAQCKFAIRTGEFTPYPNFKSGSCFPGIKHDQRRRCERQVEPSFAASFCLNRRKIFRGPGKDVYADIYSQRRT